MKARAVCVVSFSSGGDIIIGTGINRTISTSNTKNNTASRKNRVENGVRADFCGSKPHSNGDVFSRSLNDGWLVPNVRAIIAKGSNVIQFVVATATFIGL